MSALSRVALLNRLTEIKVTDDPDFFSSIAKKKDNPNYAKINKAIYETIHELNNNSRKMTYKMDKRFNQDVQDGLNENIDQINGQMAHKKQDKNDRINERVNSLGKKWFIGFFNLHILYRNFALYRLNKNYAPIEKVAVIVPHREFLPGIPLDFQTENVEIIRDSGPPIQDVFGGIYAANRSSHLLQFFVILDDVQEKSLLFVINTDKSCWVCEEFTESEAKEVENPYTIKEIKPPFDEIEAEARTIDFYLFDDLKYKLLHLD